MWRDTYLFNFLFKYPIAIALVVCVNVLFGESSVNYILHALLYNEHILPEQLKEGIGLILGSVTIPVALGLWFASLFGAHYPLIHGIDFHWMMWYK